MEQDKDLDPLRNEPGYAELLARLKAEFVLPAAPLPPGEPPSPDPYGTGKQPAMDAR